MATKKHDTGFGDSVEITDRYGAPFAMCVEVDGDTKTISLKVEDALAIARTLNAFAELYSPQR